MNLIQHRAVLPVVIMAIVVAVLGTLLVSSQFVFGQEDPTGCTAAGSGTLIETRDAEGNNVTRVSHGDQIFYTVSLSIPELREGQACNFSGGRLSVVLPNGDTVEVAGYEGRPEIPLVSVGAVFAGPEVPYTVDQTDAVNSVLEIRASYDNGSSHSVPEGETRPPQRGGGSNHVLMVDPAIQIQINPPTQVVYRGGSAGFDITVANNGGFELSGVAVESSLTDECTRELGILAVGASETYSCSYVPDEDATHEVTVRGQIIGGVPATQAEVEDSSSAEVVVATILATIDLTPDLQQVRVGNNAVITVVLHNPSLADLTDVTVTVPAAPECDNVVGPLAIDQSITYECEPSLPQGTHEITGTVMGEADGIDTTPTSDTVIVEVFALGLYILKEPDERTIHKGDSAQFTITIGNGGDSSLSSVIVTDILSPDCSRAEGELLDLDPGDIQTYECESPQLEDGIINEIDVVATAPDGDSVDASASAVVNLIKPATALQITTTDGLNLRIMVNVLTITEANLGDDPLTDPYVEIDTLGTRIDKDSPEFVGGDTSDDGILDPGEVWEWRLVTVTVVGEGLFLPEGSTVATYQATGHGTDSLGADVTFPASLTERDTVDVPIFN